MSCGCTSPCSCSDSCDPNNEPLSSALNNFITSFFGTLTKTCVNNEVNWILPCDLSTGNSILPRNSGEGIACYLLRLFNSIQTLSMTCLDFRKIFINGNCYDTLQEAYDANATQAVPTVMVIGAGSFGNLALTANYNSNIVLFGVGRGTSVLGSILSSRFDVVLEAYHLTLSGIDTRTAGVGGAIITLTGDASVNLIDNSRNDAGLGSTQGITATKWDIGEINNYHTVGGGSTGIITLTSCTCGLINNSAAGANVGDIVLKNCTSIGSILNLGLASGGRVIATESNIISGAGLNSISIIEGGSYFRNVNMKTVDTNKDCIANVLSNGAQFIGSCIIVPHGTGLPITASAARTIIAYNLLIKNDFGANVTLSEGNYNFSPNITYP